MTLGILLIAAGLVANFAVPLGATCGHFTAWDLWRLRGAVTGCTGQRNAMLGGSVAAVIIGTVLTISGVALAARRRRAGISDR